MQPTAAFCTAVLVAPDLIATAGHCLTNAVNGEYVEEDLAGIRLVFGYAMEQQHGKEVPATEFAADHVYEVRDIVEWDACLDDWAIARLDRAVTVASPVAVRRVGAARIGESVYAIGFPSGIPAKLISGKVVDKKLKRDDELATNLDSFHGNSGSPVFNARHELEGILISGEEDYKYDDTQKCYTVVTCNEDATDCTGEIVMRVTEFLHRIP
jgi:V8-like Glu-specific endopeptidase